MSADCRHYRGLLTNLRAPLDAEHFVVRRCAVCACGVCLGYWKSGAITYSPVLNEAQRAAVTFFLDPSPTTRRQFYYLSVTKPRRRKRGIPSMD